MAATQSLTNRSVAPAVSVVMPLFNKVDYVGRAIKSVLNQTFKDFELIVVDDGSTDRGPEVVRAFSDPRLRLIWQDNEGPGAARNWGIRESKAELIAFLDADDEWLPDFLSSSVAWLSKYPECVLSVSGFFQGAERQDWGRIAGRAGITEGPWRLPPQLEREEMKDFIGYFNSWAIVCRKWALERYRGFYENRCSFGEDTYLWVQIALNHQVYRSLTPLVWYHSEASELWLGRKDVLPPEPLITDPEPLRDCCPPAYRPLLEEWLTDNAAFTVRRLNRSGNFDVAGNIGKEFSVAERRPYARLKLLLDLAQGHLFRLKPAAALLFGRLVRKIMRVSARMCKDGALPANSTPSC
jgi:glycosyltransferase involved in cell wall biosynthesis